MLLVLVVFVVFGRLDRVSSKVLVLSGRFVGCYLLIVWTAA